MTQWELDEQALLAKESAWLQELSPFMRFIDNTYGFIAVMVASSSAAFLIGLGIGYAIAH
jgi:hypothetical protein